MLVHTSGNVKHHVIMSILVWGFDENPTTYFTYICKMIVRAGKYEQQQHRIFCNLTPELCDDFLCKLFILTVFDIDSQMFHTSMPSSYERQPWLQYSETKTFHYHRQEKKTRRSLEKLYTINSDFVFVTSKVFSYRLKKKICTFIE